MRTKALVRQAKEAAADNLLDVDVMIVTI